MPMNEPSTSLRRSLNDYERVERALWFLNGRFQEQPSLEDVAREAGLSPYHFQRLFRRWAGISPKRFLQYLTAVYARELLEESRSVLDVAYETGLSGPSRLHDLFVAVEAMTPAEYRNQAAGLAIRYGFHPTPFGECLISLTDRGITSLTVAERGEREEALSWLRDRWPGARFSRSDAATAAVVVAIFGSRARSAAAEVRLLLKGTNLQIKVWEALLRIPPARLVSYGSLARSIGKPDACRAVASAVGDNPVAVLIPCHRVIRSTGALGGYRWGIARKQALIGWEAARKSDTSLPQAPSVVDPGRQVLAKV